jgi:hypothetical protein
LIRVDPCSSVVAFPNRRPPKADTPINSSVQFPAKNGPKNSQVTWAYFHDSKGAHKKLDANNHCDHNELVMARTPHPDFASEGARAAKPTAWFSATYDLLPTTYASEVGDDGLGLRLGDHGGEGCLGVAHVSPAFGEEPALSEAEWVGEQGSASCYPSTSSNDCERP